MSFESVRALGRRLARPFPALPLDLFRAAAGALAVAYFTQALLDFGELTDPAGFLDHALVARVYWFSRLSLFQPGMPAWALKALLALGWTASWGVLLGHAVKPCAALAFAVAVSLSRWNLPAMGIDDAAVQLNLFWLLLLPVGRTLTAGAWLAEGRAAWRRWRGVAVPGAAARCLLGNFVLIYLVAGLSKLASPFWREGFALYATLTFPVSRTAWLWGPEHRGPLAAANYAALACELSIPWLLLLPRRGSAWRKLGLALQAALHAGIIAAFGLPYINLAMLSSTLLFHAEDALSPARGSGSWGLPSRAALALLALLSMTGLRGIPVLGALEVPSSALLWLAGLCQDYHLFNWIDSTNYRVDLDVVDPARGPGAEDGEALFPPGPAGFLLQGFVFDAWAFVPCRDRPAFKRSLLEGAARRWCAGAADGRLEAWAALRRITPADPRGTAGRTRRLMEFECRDGAGALLRAEGLDAPAPDCRPGARRPHLERLLERLQREAPGS